jgi:exodeoxyribonuclease-5
MQAVASREFQKWYKKPRRKRRRPWFEISGPAGSGKTTVVRHIIEALGISYDDVIFMAYVGKAALALRLSGVNGQTIHSAIYEPVDVPLKDEYGGYVRDSSGHIIMEPRFIKRERLPDNIKLLVVDEGGMVSEDIGRDILSFHIPTLVLGDLNQLPPVFGESIFLKKPDVILNEIMRQKKDSPIIYLSQLAIHGMPINYDTYGSEVKVIRKNELTDEMLREANLVICATNITRDAINWYMRKDIYGIDAPYIVPGDRLICRKNCWDILLPDKSLGLSVALVNGMIGTVTKTDKNNLKKGVNMKIDFQPEFSKYRFHDIPINSNYVLSAYKDRVKVNPKFSPYVVFEFGYCSTCHLAQGSQYDNVIVYVDTTFSGSDYFRKWLYTAITRAKTNLTLVL